MAPSPGVGRGHVSPGAGMAADDSTGATVPATPKSNRLGRFLLLVAGIVGVGGGIYYLIISQPTPSSEPDLSVSLKPYLHEQAKFGKLAEGYSDADGDLVADAPTDPTKWIDPPELIFTTVAGDDPAEVEAIWTPLLKKIAEKTGKKVSVLPNPPIPTPEPETEPAAEAPMPALPPGRSVEDHLDLLKSGQLHIAAFSTGQVPRAVSTAGFVPLACPADAQGNFAYQMSMIVPTNSTAKELTDLRGTIMAFVSLSSNSGAKAPMVLLKGAKMLPGRDYRYTLTGRHEISILGVCVGQRAAAILASPKSTAEQREQARKNPGEKYTSAAVADDILARMVAAGTVQADQYRVLATSDKFPPVAFGVPHNLAPKLREAITTAFQEFAFAGTPAEARFQALGRTKFAPVNYKTDWKDVREVDERLSTLLEAGK